jgi:eukaryotic-like serine/threonine-protein kinase
MDKESPPVAPVVPKSPGGKAQLNNVDMLKKDPESIRQILNEQAAEILAPGTESAYNDYEAFCGKHDQAIYQAWYLTIKEPQNKLLGHILQEQVKKGSFARVYRALDAKGNQVAIKVLHEEVRRQPEMLQSFRRGVRSMNILSNRHVKGMVPYHLAAEIPAFVVMDWVEGPNLSEAVEAKQINSWGDILRIGCDLAEIIHQAHLLPERVLHRDIRPPNIMLEGFYTDQENWKVVVLDFDLSWHHGSMELSITSPQTMNGFLAPEQLVRKGGVSTRNSAVDAYGLGMTLFYLRTGIEPIFSQHKHSDWHQKLYDEYITQPCKSWRSLPRRFARLIESATREVQSERWDIGQMARELRRLQSAQAGRRVDSAELLAEELVVRSCCATTGYKWNPDKMEAKIELLTGLTIVLRGNETNRRVELSMEWLYTGDRARPSFNKYIPRALDQAKSALRGHWELGPTSHDSKSISITASVSVPSLRDTLDSCSHCLSTAASKLHFS